MPASTRMGRVTLFPTSVVDCELLGGCPVGSAGRGKRGPDDHVERRRRHGRGLDCREHHGGDHRHGDRPRCRTDAELCDLGGADAAKFTINATTGALAFATAPNFEAPTDSGANNVYDVTVQVSDGNGGIDTQAIAVTVTNQNEVPTITSNGGGDTAAVSIAENTMAVTTVTATDPDVGTDLDLFEIGRGGCRPVHDQCDHGRAHLRDGPELRGSDRLRCQQRLRRHRAGLGRQRRDRHSSHCGHGDQPERGPNDHVERRRRHGGGRRLPRTPRR